MTTTESRASETKAGPKFLEYIMTLGMTTMEGRGFYYPVDTAIGQDGRLYVVNRSLDVVTRGVRVTMCDIDSEYYGTFGAFGDKDGQFIWPSGGAIDSKGRVYVSDEQLHRISIFDHAGLFLSRWGSHGTGEGELDTPSGIAFDDQDNLYVSDTHNSRIQVFDQDGELLYIWTHFGKPSGLFIDRNDILYAGDGLSGQLRTGPPDPWRSNFGWEKGIRIGDLKTEQAWVTHFIPQHDVDVGAGIEFLGVDFDGNIYAGEITRVRLVRYVPFRPPEIR